MTIQQKLDERYGRTRRSRRFWSVFAGLGIALAVGVVAWFAFSPAAASVDATTTGFEVVSDHSVAVTFQVTAPAGTSIACAVEAQDEEHGIVGWKVVEYPGSAERSRAFRESIPVTAPATTGFVNACWVP